MDFEDFAAIPTVLNDRLDPLLVSGMHSKELLDVPIAKQFFLIDAENLESLLLCNKFTTDSEAFDRNLHLLT